MGGIAGLLIARLASLTAAIPLPFGTTTIPVAPLIGGAAGGFAGAAYLFIRQWLPRIRPEPRP